MGAPLYDRIFHRLEKARWRLAEVPFQQVDRSCVSDDTLARVRVNCLMELSSLYATRMFLRDFRANPDFCQFMSVWYYEEMKHYLVLREYLKVFDSAPETDTFPGLDTELSPSPWPPTLALHYCGELRLGMWYHRWSRQAPEPVLAQVYQLIGNDEFRHAACYEEFMEQALERDRGLLPQFLQAAKWMLVNPAGDKHPTTMKSDRATDTSVVDRIEDYGLLQTQIQQSISDEDEDALKGKVLATLSRLSGTRMSRLSDLSALARELTRGGPGAREAAPGPAAAGPVG